MLKLKSGAAYRLPDGEYYIAIDAGNSIYFLYRREFSKDPPAYVIRPEGTIHTWQSDELRFRVEQLTPEWHMTKGGEGGPA